MFNPQTFENSRPDGFPVLEVVERGTEGRTPPETRRQFVPLHHTSLTGAIVGPVAALTLSQRFRFAASQYPRPIEALYRFPLPGDAAVTGVHVSFGDVQIGAVLAERATAEQEYRTARNEGRQAALLTREAPDVFTLQVSGIRPHEDVVVETSYAQLCRTEGAGWSLRVPLTTVPRFVRGDEYGSPHANGQPLAVLRDPGHRFSLALTVDVADDLTSPTHEVEVTPEADRLHVRLRTGEVAPDRDCVLHWQTRQRTEQATLQVLGHADADGNTSHFLALVVPPADTGTTEAVPREVIVLIDHSGSMSGPKWEAADWAVQNLLAGLTAADTFSLGLFHTTTRWFARQPMRADERTVRQAREFLLAHTDSGGTELGVALEQALAQPRDGAVRARHVVIVTDAQVSDAGRIMTLVEREASRSDRRRIDVLCIDAAPNSGLALEVSERGGGIARFLTSDPAENDIASALDDVLGDWAAPVLHDLTLQIDSASVQAAGHKVIRDGAGSSSVDLGNLPAGRAVWVAGRVNGRAGTPPTFRLLAGGREIGSSVAGPSDAAVGRPAIAALFGARRVLDIELAQHAGADLDERLRQLGYDPDALRSLSGVPDRPPLYAENARQRTTDLLHDLLVRESLRYGIACSATAFVATRTEAGERIARTVAVANALAHGWSQEFLMPRMAMVGPMPMAAPMLMAAPMRRSMPTPSGAVGAPPPPGADFLGLPPDLAPFIREASQPLSAHPPQAPGSAGQFDLGRLAGGPLDAARGLLRRLRRSERESHPGFGPDRELVGSAQDDAPDQLAHDASSLFTGIPVFHSGTAILFEAPATASIGLPGGTLSRLEVAFASAATHYLDAGLVIEVFVDDLTTARARVKLADLMRQGGERPLNIRYRAGQIIRVALRDSRGAWATGAPAMSASLR